ncbi:hypothetical protein TVAG_205540 [Trichomonas vaginalis G3]|uniref:DUF3447 domain-containing protein n=1 Tax=Trichomonas vaginalis (strain ATCC PRA-98 / G3) TaxID=412133 RepID=A2FJE3_TRIV3|nr:hypothetical protein TVAG_205540 [Trichomonas vaginalis G3]|eukprot:XP_001307886.1 hypothetical protein [Trichomonas vaginalis G3]
MGEFPPELEKAIQLQTTIGNLNEENIDASIEQIMASIYVEEENLPDLCREIVRMVPIRSTHIPLYTKFLTALAKKMPDQDLFEDILLDVIIDEDVPQLSYQLRKNDILGVKDVIKKNHTFKTNLFFDEFNDESVLFDMDVFKGKKEDDLWKQPLEELRENLWLANSLQFAIKSDNVDAAQNLVIAEGDNADWKKPLEWSEFEVSEAPPSTTVLGLAAYFGAPKVWLFLKTNYNLEITPEIAQCAVMGGNMEIIKDCEDKIKDCNEFAFRFHHQSVFEWLLEKEECKLTPIDAIMSHNYKFLVSLIKKGTDINTLSITEPGISPLIFAVQHSFRNVIQYLINSGASVDQSDRNGLTPLHIAIKGDDIKTAEVLIKNGANVNAKDSKGNTPLMQACIIGSLRCVKLLLGNKADPSIPDNKGNVPARRTFNTDIQKLLAEAQN